MNSIDSQFNKTFRKIMNLPPDTPLEEISDKNFPGWGSLRHVELILKLENTFNINFTSAEITNLRSVQELKKSIKDKLKAKEL